jgi:hypothetical protein
MEEPAGLHRIYDGPVGAFYDAQTHGPLQLELRRINHEEYRLLRRFGYQDHMYDEPFVCPINVDTYRTDLASIPWFFQWAVPSRGTHFPAIMLHDALVIGEGDDPTHLGPEVDREEADRIMRDAMGQLGVGFVRRWLAWTGAAAATIATKSPRLKSSLLLALTFLPIVVLGIVATIDLFDWWNPLPWMGDRNTGLELLGGALGAVVVPALLSLFWWPRWRVVLIGGIMLAFLLHVTLLMMASWLVYMGLEMITKRKLTRPSDEVAAAQDALVAGMRVTEQVGKGSSTFTDLRVPRSTVRISVTGPGMLVDGFKLVTDIGILEGHSHPALLELAAEITSTSYCGMTGPLSTPVTVEVDRQGPALKIGVGPANMYESVIEISTTGATFEELLRETIASGTGRGFIAGLVPIAAGGNPEHADHQSGRSIEGATTDTTSRTEIADAADRDVGHGHS